ncbi:TRAP-type C4-dicarboxylate transport system, small permease component [Ruegeria halocynthiae]|uniref:TRAP transporter small permease protein n=1 Tax=Ruegeria halocynthiae TaxID=985054 RepID=A0A1H2W9D3_9RHOB|nr:TRAP transporter small permease subunit [Ruegeria halocynthiae]SDW77252.1 TRAP-type C4-dicarboxylate transport system, small permease component [Ruegeria halocynthiae]
MTPIIQLVRRASALPVIVACIALFILMAMTFCDVILRSVFNAPIEAATELTRILMAILVFSVLPIVSTTNGHIAVDLTDGFFNRLHLSHARDVVIYVLSGIMLFWPVQRVLVLAERARDYGDVTEYLAIPTYLIGWFIALSVAITALVMIATGLLKAFAPNTLSEPLQ